MWFVLDIGNSAIKGGFFDNGMLTRSFSMRSDPRASVPAYRHALHEKVASTTPQRVGIVSVVPQLTRTLSEAVRNELMVLPEVLHAGMVLPIELGYRTPDTLGTDRLAAACAASRFFARDERDRARSVVIVDAGTAITVDAVDARGVYRGGAIAPGPRLCLAALARGTAQLPEVPMQLPRHAIGKSTVEALQSGVMFGFIETVAGLLDRMKTQVKRNPFVVATGGWATFLKEHISAIDRVEEELVLYGGRILLEMNPVSRIA